ncbi:MAG: hypothetical protein IPL52_11300 [Flavobacteriales bacterium]|nr:hypothetical protein [Flavobacteriales bacterium]
MQVAKGIEGLLQWGGLRTALAADWSTANATQVSELVDMAYAHAPAGGALAWATALELGAIDSLPIPVIPAELKSTHHWRKRERSNMEQPLIGVFPNPARDRVAFTVPLGMEAGSLELRDPLGRLVRAISWLAAPVSSKPRCGRWVRGSTP